MKRIIAVLVALVLLCLGCAAEASEKQDRYKKLFQDSSFSYYMDMKNAKWVLFADGKREYIIDVWVKLVRNDQSSESAYQEKVYEESMGNYYLEHYYIRPASQQIQFLCELEVSGRPDNDIKQRPYSSANWEELVPGSVEDSIYHTVVPIMNKVSKTSGKNKLLSDIGDGIEDIFRISL